jgi:hypothetical protein
MSKVRKAENLAHSGLTRKYHTRPERLARKKQSRLFSLLISYDLKSFVNTIQFFQSQILVFKIPPTLSMIAVKNVV